MTPAKTHRFTLTLRHPHELTTAFADSLCGGASDVVIWSRFGVIRVDFRRSASSLVEAVKSAIDQVSRSGHLIAMVELGEAMEGGTTP